jgi:hypothetical protein
LKITHVLYQATISTGNYENEKIGLSADLEEGDSVEATVEDLRKQVFTLANRADDYYNAQKLKREIEQLEAKVQSARSQWEEVSTFLQAQGLKTEPAPFPTLLKAIAPMSERVIAEVVDDDDDRDYDPLADE